jgi:hypothetical protein
MAVAVNRRPTGLRKHARTRRDEGTVTPMMLVMAGGILVLIGLAYDGGTYYDDQQHADFVAQEAARAGAQDVDVGRYLATGRAGLDPAKATADVTAYLGGVKDMKIDMSTVAVYFGPDDGSIQVTFTVDRSGVFLTDKAWGVDRAYGNAVVVLEQGVTDAGG